MSFPRQQVIGQEDIVPSCAKGGLNIRKNLFSEGVVLLRCPGSGGMTIPGGVQEMTRHGI